MSRVPLVLSVVALAALGCATSTSSKLELPDVSAASLSAAGGAADSNGWSTLEPSAAVSGLTGSASSSSPAVARSGRHITFMGGKRWLDNDWEPLDEPAAFGLEFDDSNPGSGHGYEVGVLYTNDDDDESFPIIGEVEAEATTYELYGGYRHTFDADDSGLHPFVSAGLNVMYGELELSALGESDDDHDTVFGAYARAGLLWDIGERLRLGLDYRHLFTEDLEVFDDDVDSDYDQVMLSLGWAF
jgi:hypothetical protein